MIRAIFALILLSFTAPLFAQRVVISSEAENISLTVYRAPNRGERPINKNWPQGYALITETRTVSIPAGESMIRFEGVAEGMFPESAIVTGLPQGVSEKNRDARLLSPAGLVDAYLKREVTISRTNTATGKTTQQQAIITAGHNGVILQTDKGYEALSCTGLPERMVYGGVPKDLSAKPTLSVITQSDRPISAKLTLTYMSGGFDWQANYLLKMSDEKVPTPGTENEMRSKASLFAWLTLANGGNQSFPNANTMAIAGEPNRVRRSAQPRPKGEGLRLKCWPMQRTHQVPFRGLKNHPRGIPTPRSLAAAYDGAELEEIIVTARKQSASALDVPVAAIKAEQENLGDLKLYRVPEPVSVNAKGQKQVAMITKPAALFDRIYAANVEDYTDSFAGEKMPLGIVLRSENRENLGLGVPLPSGQVAIFEPSSFGSLLAGEANIQDKAIGNELEIEVGKASNIMLQIRSLNKKAGKKRFKFRATITNANNYPIKAEVEIPYQLNRRSKQIKKIDGIPTWLVTVPANGEATINYSYKLSS